MKRKRWPTSSPAAPRSGQSSSATASTSRSRSSTFHGLGTPSNTPAEIIETLNKEISAGLADPKIKARLADLGRTVLAGSPADFGKLIANETEKWAKEIGRPTSGLSNQNADFQCLLYLRKRTFLRVYECAP